MREREREIKEEKVSGTNELTKKLAGTNYFTGTKFSTRKFSWY
jgi:hypothetical protein